MELNKNDTENLKSGLIQPFWQVLKTFLNERVEFLKERILNDDTLVEEIRITNRDLLRKEYQLTKWLLDLPENLIKSDDTYKIKMEEYDPYDKG